MIYKVVVRKTMITEFNVKVNADSVKQAEDAADDPANWIWNDAETGLDEEPEVCYDVQGAHRDNGEE